MPYAKPPEHSRFKKGQSGNPAGRPKKAATFVDDLLDEVQLLAAGSTWSNQRAIVKTLVAAARDGHFPSMGLIASLLARVQSADNEQGDEATTIAEADIIEHVAPASPAESGGSQVLPPTPSKTNDSEGGDDGERR
jgi:hypothetical protein